MREITGFFGSHPVKLLKMPVSPQLISQIALLNALPEEELAQLSQEMILQEYPRRGVVLAKGSPSKSLGFLIAGRLQGVDFTVDGRSVGLYFVEPRDYFGEISVIDGKAPAEFVIAASPSVVAHLNMVRAQELIMKYPSIAQQLLARMALRVRNVIAQRTLLGLPNPIQRLCVLLMQLPGAPANMINTSRETVTRAFQVMTQQKILIREGNQLKVLQFNILKDIAEGRKESPKTSS